MFGFFIRDTRPDAFMHGMHLSIMTAAALLMYGSVICIYGIRTPRPGHIERPQDSDLRQIRPEAMCMHLESMAMTYVGL